MFLFVLPHEIHFRVDGGEREPDSLIRRSAAQQQVTSLLVRLVNTEFDKRLAAPIAAAAPAEQTRLKMLGAARPSP